MPDSPTPADIRARLRELGYLKNPLDRFVFGGGSAGGALIWRWARARAVRSSPGRCSRDSGLFYWAMSWRRMKSRAGFSPSLSCSDL